MSKPSLRTCIKIQIIDVASSAQGSGDTAGELTTVEVIVTTLWMQAFPDNVQCDPPATRGAGYVLYCRPASSRLWCSNRTFFLNLIGRPLMPTGSGFYLARP